MFAFIVDRLGLLAGAALVARRARAWPSRPAHRRPRRRQARLHPRRLRPLRAQDRLRHAGPGAGLHHPQRRPGARAWPGVGECPDQRPAHRQQVGRRDRRTAEDRRRAMSSGSRSSRPPASASPACRARSPTSSSRRRKKASGQFEWRPDFRAHYAKPNLFARLGQLLRQARARSIIRSRSRTTPGAAPSAARSVIYDANGVDCRERAHEISTTNPTSSPVRASSSSTGRARRSAI